MPKDIHMSHHILTGSEISNSVYLSLSHVAVLKQHRSRVRADDMKARIDQRAHFHYGPEIERHSTVHELRSRCSVQSNLRPFRQIGGQARSSHNLAISPALPGYVPGRVQHFMDSRAPSIEGQQVHRLMDGMQTSRSVRRGGKMRRLRDRQAK